MHLPVDSASHTQYTLAVPGDDAYTVVTLFPKAAQRLQTCAANAANIASETSKICPKDKHLSFYLLCPFVAVTDVARSQSTLLISKTKGDRGPSQHVSAISCADGVFSLKRTCTRAVKERSDQRKQRAASVADTAPFVKHVRTGTGSISLQIYCLDGCSILISGVAQVCRHIPARKHRVCM